MRARSTFLALLYASVLCAAVVPAAAQTDSADLKAAAEALFNQGRQLMEEGRFAEACTKFEASNRLDPSVGTVLNLGVCREQNGETALAWETFRQGADMAREAGDNREAYARERMAALGQGLHFVYIEVPDQARIQGLRVLLDDTPAPEASWNRPLIVTAGTHVVRATAPDRMPFEARVEVSTPGEENRIAVPVLEAPPPPEPVATEDVTPAPAPALTAKTDSGPPMPLRRKLALGSGVAGAVGLVLGGVYGVKARSTYGDAEDICSVATSLMTCSPEEKEASQALRDDARGQANVATAASVIGIAAIAAGAVLWYTTPPAAQETVAPAAATRIAPILGRDVAGLSLHTTF